MTDTDDLIRAAIHELVTAAPAPRSPDEAVAAPSTSPMERMVPVSMNDRTRTRRPTPAALGAVAASLAVVGSLWYLTSDTSDPADTGRQAGLDHPTDQSTELPAPTSAPEPTGVATDAPTTTFAPPAVQRASIIAPIAPGEVELADGEVLVLDGDRVVAVDVDTTTARIVTAAPAAERLVGVIAGAVVVERCCDAELVVASDGSSPVRTTELDLETGETTERAATGWRLASIQPRGDRLAAVVGTDLVITSPTEGSGTVRDLLELGREDHEPVFGTVTDLGWTSNAASIVLIEQLGGGVIVHRVGGSTGAHVGRAVVAPVESVDQVEFAGFGSGGSIAVAVVPAGSDGGEVQFFDQTTLRLVDRVELPVGIERVRSVGDGSLVWIEAGIITIRRPDGELIDIALP